MPAGGASAALASPPQTLTITTGTFLVQELLYEVTLDSPTGSFVWAGIPQNYDHIAFVMYARGNSGSNTDVQAFLNGDATAANYRRIVHVALDGTHNIFAGDDSDFASVPGVTSPAGAFGYLTAELPFYTQTGTMRIIRSWESERRAAASTFIGTWHTQWEQFAAVQSLRASVEVGQFVSGSVFRGYGIAHRSLVTSVRLV
jgi:hypothetical protein